MKIRNLQFVSYKVCEQIRGNEIGVTCNTYQKSRESCIQFFSVIVISPAKITSIYLISLHIYQHDRRNCSDSGVYPLIRFRQNDGQWWNVNRILYVPPRTSKCISGEQGDKVAEISVPVIFREKLRYEKYGSDFSIWKCNGLDVVPLYRAQKTLKLSLSLVSSVTSCWLFRYVVCHVRTSRKWLWH
jgi:hypothetical protein